MKTSLENYQSFLVRLWREDLEDQWRVTLQEVMSRKSYNFSSLAEMFEFLNSQGEEFPRVVRQHEEALFE